MLVAKKMKNAGSPFVKMRLILQRITTPRHLLSKNVSENGLRIQIIIILLNFMQLYLNPKMGAVK